MKKSLFVLALAFAGCTEAVPDEGTLESAAVVTHFLANGNGADVFLTDGNNGGFLTVADSTSNGTRTVVLSFSITFVDPLDGTRFAQDQGSGNITPSNFSATLSTGSLVTTTTFPITHCEYSTISGLIGCSAGTAKSFNLTWTKNSLSSFTSRGTQENTFGCSTITNQGNFSGVTAYVSGSWAGKTSAQDSGTLNDNHQTTVTKDFTNSCI